MSDEARMKEILRTCDTAFKEGRFEEIGLTLDGLDLKALGPNLLVGWLSFTYPARRQLGEYRKRLVERVRPLLVEHIGEEPVARIYSRLG